VERMYVLHITTTMKKFFPCTFGLAQSKHRRPVSQ
jgi:hypothetical protein